MLNKSEGFKRHKKYEANIFENNFISIRLFKTEIATTKEQILAVLLTKSLDSERGFAFINSSSKFIFKNNSLIKSNVPKNGC